MVDVGTVVVRGALDGNRHQCLVVVAVIWCRGWRSVGWFLDGRCCRCSPLVEFGG
jgi:hypothetical protein